MTSPPMEGTFQLDGLFEGPLFSPEDWTDLEDFVTQARQDQLYFALTRQFNRFSLLGDPHPRHTPPAVSSIDCLVTQHLNQLLHQYSLDERKQFTSTIRSTEFTQGQEIQTLYPIGQNGTIQIEQRTVNRPTRPAKTPLSRHQILLYSVITMAILVLSILFVPYKQLISSVTHRTLAYDMDTLPVTATDFNDLFDIQSVEYNATQPALIVTCKLKASFPMTREAINQTWLDTNQSLFDRLAIEAIARQQIRCLLYAESNTLLRQWAIPMTRSKNQESLFTLTIPFDPETKSITLTY